MLKYQKRYCPCCSAEIAVKKFEATQAKIVKFQYICQSCGISLMLTIKDNELIVSARKN